ncbi:unnamed protein product [Ectocarpus sp. CCAP 1310/34]|nr:unnamed protein product [Ectocarpus sp. CCAP 1310/34]
MAYRATQTCGCYAGFGGRHTTPLTAGALPAGVPLEKRAGEPEEDQPNILIFCFSAANKKLLCVCLSLSVFPLT